MEVHNGQRDDYLHIISQEKSPVPPSTYTKPSPGHSAACIQTPTQKAHTHTRAHAHTAGRMGRL